MEQKFGSECNDPLCQCNVNVRHCFESLSGSVSNIQAFGNLKLLPKHYFKLTSTGSGDLLTTNRVPRQNVCVGGGNVSVFYVYVSCCNLSDKGALIDTFGRLGWERGTGPALLRADTKRVFV